jgi:hypothetical protein
LPREGSIFEHLAQLSHHRPRRVLLAVLLFVVVCGILGGPVAGKLSSTGANFEDSSSQSVRARNLVEHRSGGPLPGHVLTVS